MGRGFAGDAGQRLKDEYRRMRHSARSRFYAQEGPQKTGFPEDSGGGRQRCHRYSDISLDSKRKWEEKP